LICCDRQSLKGGLITGSIASICAFILGPAGLAVGGAVGGMYFETDRVSHKM